MELYAWPLIKDSARREAVELISETGYISKEELVELEGTTS